MRDLKFFDKKGDYENYVKWELMGTVQEWNSPFYNNLIQYTLDHKAPIFYAISDPSEHFAFSGAYHFETRRDRYPNKHRECLFWLHDFTHMLFPYAHDLFAISEQEFIDQFIYQERIASTETEIFAYYRVPGLREKVFPDEKLYYDVMMERGYYGNFGLPGNECYTKKPDAWHFLQHRNRVINDDTYGEKELGDYPEILQFFRKWKTLTPKWCSERYRSMAGIRVPRPVNWNTLNVTNYEKVIEGYESHATQEQYEMITMANVHMAFAMLGWEDPPTRWRHMPEAFDQLEGAVFFQRGN